MKRLAPLALFLFPFFSPAQDSLVFRIISISGQVKADGRPVQPGHRVYASAVKLEVDGRSHANVLTEQGYAHKLRRGKYRVRKINKIIYRKLNPVVPVGAVHRSLEWIQFIPSLHPHESFVYGDSVYLGWKSQKAGVHKFTLYTIFEDKLMDTIPETNFVLIATKQWFERENYLMFDVSVGQESPTKRVLQKMTDAQRSTTRTMLQQNREPEFVDRKLVELALLDTEKLLYDLGYALYKLRQWEKKQHTRIEHRYYHALLKKYEMSDL